MRNRVQFDGTTLQAWQLVNSGSVPSETDWSSATRVVNATTPFRTTGGLVGIRNTNSGDNDLIGNLTIKSWDTATNAFDKTEAIENFAIDGSGYANDTLTSDANGNQTYDGTHAYTYDPWNRLITVSHASRDSSGNLQIGQAEVTMSYDAKGRRIMKTVANTGQWDCTYHYYLDRDSVVEEQNGSGQTIKQFVWGKQYIDELIQTSLNSSPTSQSTCDTPYWACQDANWNVLGIVNSSGVLTERYEYSAYGQRSTYFSAGTNDPDCMSPTMASQRFIASGSVTEPYGLCEVGHQGLFHDEETGLLYDRRRLESPTLDRFLQRDPGSYITGFNLYEDRKSAPDMFLDPKGLDAGWAGGGGDPWGGQLPGKRTSTIYLECRSTGDDPGAHSGGRGILIGSGGAAQHCSVVACCNENGSSGGCTRYELGAGPTDLGSGSTDPNDNTTVGGNPTLGIPGITVPRWSRYPITPMAPTGGRPFPDDRGCHQPDCGVARCIASQYQSMLSAVPPYSIWGPNSNTFAKSLLGRCGLGLAPPLKQPPGAIGWSSPSY